jgi:hypothetical protein
MSRAHSRTPPRRDLWLDRMVAATSENILNLSVDPLVLESCSFKRFPSPY